MLFISYGARAQETRETVTVNDVDRTYLLRLPGGTITSRNIRW
jgi:hypothetical protein